MLLLGVSKCHYNGTKCKGIRNKLYWKILFYDDTGRFFTRRIPIWKVFYYKLKKKAHIRSCFYCKEKYATYQDKIICELCSSFGTDQSRGIE